VRHKFLVITMKKWLKLVHIYGSYRKIKTGVSLFFGPPGSGSSSSMMLLLCLLSMWPNHKFMALPEGTYCCYIKLHRQNVRFKTQQC